MLEQLGDPHYTTELGQFQLEANADPQLLRRRRPRRDGEAARRARRKARAAAAELGIAPVLMGILPTMRKTDLGLDSMVPSPRYTRAQQGDRRAARRRVRVLDQGHSTS